MRYWIWLTQLQHMGPITVNKLLEVFKTPDAVYQADEASLREIEGINKKQIEKILTDKSLVEAEEIIRSCMKHKISILTKSDPRYHRKAGDLTDAPPVLYYQGALREIGNSVGIVGARRCSQKMKQKCVEIAQSYIQQGIAIVSGMAKGIDAYASTVCVNEGGYTIAVLGNGLDICYPAEHQPLMNRIREQGVEKASEDVYEKPSVSTIHMNAVIGLETGNKVIWIKPYKKSPLRTAKRAYKKLNFDILPVSRKCCGDKIISKSVNYVIYLLSRDLNGQKAVKTVFAIVDEQHILLSDTICGHNGLEGQFGSSAMELEKFLCDSFGIDKRNIRVEQIEHFL
ncbi:MAG: DNA-processing protein DprA [Firmicutes bacterium]|nr:DNA-processing protein DprA [Bacillota bacterium]